MIVALHHAQITIPGGKEEEARRFYCGVLGLKEIDKPSALRARGGFWLQVGGAQVHVAIEDGVDRLATKAHLAYEVSDLSHWRKLISANGTEPVAGVPIPGCSRFEFRDPFGNRIELIQMVTGTEAKR